MDLNDLKIFQTVARLGSITRAAEELNYVQSNVTARIKLLEKSLQTPLFNRHKRGVVLNTEGKLLLKYANDITSKVDEVKNIFSNPTNPSGVLEIGIIETVASLPRILSSYCNKYPNAELSLHADVTENLLQDVIESKLDGAFVTGPILHPFIEQVEVIQERLTLVSKADTFSLSQLATTPLLLYTKGCGYRERLENWLKVQGIIPKQIMEFGTFGTIIGSVAAGIGITVVPESSASQMAAEGTVHFHSLPEPYNEITTVFIRRKDTFLTNTLRSFIDEIKRHTTQHS